MEEKEEKEVRKTIVNNFQGAKINNFVYNDHGTTNIYGDASAQNTEAASPEQIALAISSINGIDKPLDSQQAWLGVCCLLAWKYGFPRNLGDCCKKIETLPLGNLKYECKYESIRKFGSWKFVKENVKDWPTYVPREDERQMFEKCLYVAQALDDSIKNQLLQS